MKNKFLALILLGAASSVMAADAVSSAMATDVKADLPAASSLGHYTSSYTPMHTDWPPRKEPIKLHQLFSVGTGHSGIDGKGFELTQILLGTEDKIKAFRLLPEDLQIQTAVDFSKLATAFAGYKPAVLDTDAFEKRCADLLAGISVNFSPESLAYKIDTTD